MSIPHLLFVTGRLAEPALRDVLASLPHDADFRYDIAVLPITVAALLHVGWMERKLSIPPEVTRVIVPGWCQGELDRLSTRWNVPFERGPKDLLDLPEYLGRSRRGLPALDAFSIEILAEVNHAPRIADVELLQLADRYRAAGADLIDLGCIPGESWSGIGAAVSQLRREGHRVSVDSFDQREVAAGVEAGAELVLSVNNSNLSWASQIPAEFVAIPDTPENIGSLEATRTLMRQHGRPLRCDPILEPIGFGFARSLHRYFEFRRRFPDEPMMMGVGNLTELSEVDSAGMNFLLAAICEELRITSVLTTEVINWCRSSVQELDAARRIVRYSVEQQRLPKHLDGRLLLLRDAKLKERGERQLAELAANITDPNFRIFAERGEIHLLNRDGYWHGDDPYEVFDRMLAAVGSLTAEHSFYLGMELMKARTALTLGKQYVQDEALRWGFLTRDEVSALERRKDHRTALTSRPSIPPTLPDETPPLPSPVDSGSIAGIPTDSPQ